MVKTFYEAPGGGNGSFCPRTFGAFLGATGGERNRAEKPFGARPRFFLIPHQTGGVGKPGAPARLEIARSYLSRAQDDLSSLLGGLQKSRHADRQARRWGDRKRRNAACDCFHHHGWKLAGSPKKKAEKEPAFRRTALHPLKRRGGCFSANSPWGGNGSFCPTDLWGVSGRRR